MKRLILLLLSMIVCTTFHSWAQSVSIDGIKYNLKVVDSENIAEAVGVADKALQEIIIPESVIYNNETYTVTDIATEAFSRLQDQGIYVNTIDIPESVEHIGDFAFSGFSGDLILRCYYSNGMNDWCFLNCSGLTIYVHKNDESKWKNLAGGSYYEYRYLESPYYISSLTSYLCGCRLYLYENKFYIGEKKPVKPIISVDNNSGGEEATVVNPDSDGSYLIDGIDPDPNKTHYIIIKALDEDGNEIYCNDKYGEKHDESVYSFNTQTASHGNFIISTCTLTTISFAQIALQDPTIKSIMVTVRLNEIGGWTKVPCKFTGLKYNHTYTCDFNITVESGNRVISWNYEGLKYSTKDLGIKNLKSIVGPTSYDYEMSYDNSDDAITHVVLSLEDQSVEGTSALFTGLVPDSKYKITQTFYSGNTVFATTTHEFTTPKLSLNTIRPKCVSATSAIVAAETNIKDIETNAGFQWKKYDAPASLAPNEGYSAIYDGYLEGYIRNLQTTSYYNVRAFYKTAKGTYFYGDWITFDPSDFSYFEPTVHTYAAVVSPNSVTFKGYALPGSDDIIEQGFEYWPVGSPQNIRSAKAPSTFNTIIATGQVMTVTLEDLAPETTYNYRAFVRTPSGKTYGEEQTFTTIDTAGVAEICADDESDIIGYYDLRGHRYSSPVQGFNIVIYSNGTSRKIFVR